MSRKERLAKVFNVGDACEFQREAGAAWERGTYEKRYDPVEWKGWHRVKFDDVSPPRYIDASNGMDTRPDDPQAVMVRAVNVPSCRLRKPGSLGAP